MTNQKVYLKKLKLPEKYINEPAVAIMLKKPGTLSKQDKKWLISYVAVLELRDIKPEVISRDKLSEAFIKTLKKGE